MEKVFFELTIIVFLAALLSYFFRLLKQPAILAYILVGILLGPLGILDLQNQDALRTFGQVGITLLLFILGLELKLHELRSSGKTILIAGFLQMWFTFFLCLSLLLLLGFEHVSSLYLAAAITFSSTIVIVKVLSDKKDLMSLHGKLAIGILLVQDFIAVSTIVFLSGVQGSTNTSFFVFQIVFILFKIAVLFGVVVFLSERVLPRVLGSVARSADSLFLFSLAWVFVFAAIVSSPLVGFSLEIGGFLAGLALANSAENFQIVAKMRPLRDFFITIFFVVLGLEMRIDNIVGVIYPSLIIILFVLIAKPLLVMIITRFLGYKRRTSFMTGITMGQVSEFSLILLFVGRRMGHISSDAIATGLLVSVASFAFSSSMMYHANALYRRLHKYLTFLDGKSIIDESAIERGSSYEHLDDHIVVVGYDEMGRSIVRSLEDMKEPVLVVDFNPDIIQRLQKEGTPFLFGDIADTEIQDRAGFVHAKLVVSTVPDIEDNLLLIDGLSRVNKKAKVIVMALDGGDGKELYKAGADYVVLPHLAGGRHVALILKDFTHTTLNRFKEKDLAYLR